MVSSSNAVVTGHFNFMAGLRDCDLTPEEKDKIVWFNQVRDPVDQFISNFYFVRSSAKDGIFVPNQVSQIYLSFEYTYAYFNAIVSTAQC